MRFYAITFDQVIIRFYAMMAAVLIGMFSGYYAIAFLALPLFLSAILGIQFRSPRSAKRAATAPKVTAAPTKVVQLPTAAPAIAVDTKVA